MNGYQSQLDAPPKPGTSSVAYEFPIGNGGKKSQFIAGDKVHQDHGDLGEPSPVYLKNGPRRDRECKDSLCLIIFMLFIAYYVIAFFQMILIDFQFERFSVPHDPDHRPCGHKEFKNHHFIFFASPEADYLYRTVCVKECPKDLPQDLTGYSLDCLPNSVIPECKYNPSKDPTKQFLVYETVVYLNSVCLPTDKHLFEEISPALTMNRMQQQIGNIKKTMHVIVLAAILSFIFGGVFFGFLGSCGDFLTWFFLFCFISFMGVLGVVFFYRGTTGVIPIVETTENPEDLDYINKRIESLKEYKSYFIMAAIACWLFSLTTLGLIVYFNKKIKIVSAQLKIAASFINENKFIMAVPLCLFFILLCFFTFWVYLCIQIMGSSAEFSDEKRLPFNQFAITPSLVMKILLHFVFLLIFRGFLVGCSDFIVYSSCCIWYYKKDRDSKAASQADCMLTSLKRMIFYHLGSIVFLGTIQTLLDYPIRFMNVVCDYMRELKKKERSQSSYYTASTFLCVCACFDSFLRYLNRYSLLYIALSGDNYYSSSKQSYYLLRRNARRFNMIRNIGGYFFTISKLFLSLLSSLLCYCAIIAIPHYNQKVADLLAPTCAFFLLSYTTASFFIDMYQDSSTTLVLTTYIDEEVEKNHFGKDDAFNCPHVIRGFLNSLRNAR